MKKRLLLFIFSLLFHVISAQDYSKVDNKVKQYPKHFKSVKKLATRINNDFSLDIDKVRAAYYWLANTIEYDFISKNNITKKVLNKDSFSKDLYNINKPKYAQTCLINKKAVCAGYSLLLKYTLDEMNIPCEYIIGDVKTSAREIGTNTRLTHHAWNAVKINTKWHLIDVTWSTGNTVDRPRVFDFSDVYFLIAPEKLILNHYPNNKKWQLLKKTISKSDFIYKPIFYENYFISGLLLNNNSFGLIKCKTRAYITLVFDKVDTTKKYYYSFEKDEYGTPLNFTLKDGKYYSKIEFKSNHRAYLTIASNTNGLIQFKIIPSF